MTAVGLATAGSVNAQLNVNALATPT